MNKIQLSHRMYSIADIKRLLENKEIIIQPKYQRRRTAWPNTAKSGLIDTIVYNYPIQPIYLREFLTETRERKKEIIDGQQRISTIIEFINGNFELSKNFQDGEYKGYKFSDLPFETQQSILNYELSFISVRDADESDIISIFSRINSYTLPLNPQEKRNAEYTGQFKDLVYKLSANYISFWSQYKIFTDAQIARMKDAEFTSEILTIILWGFDGYSKDKINKVYKEYDNDFNNRDFYFDSFNNIMSVIGNLFENSLIHQFYRKEAWFFTFFLALYELLYGKLEKLKMYSFKKVDIKLLEYKLIGIIGKYNKNEYDSSISLLFQQSTGKTPNRIKRHNFLFSELKIYV
jgi:hypothetical protein